MVPAFTLGFSALFTGDERFAGYREIGAASMLFAVVYSLRGYHVLGFSPAFAAAVFAALWAGTGSCRSVVKRSALRPAGEAARRGCAAGLIAGIACSVDVSGLMNLDTELLFAPCIAAGAGLRGGGCSRGSRTRSRRLRCVLCRSFSGPVGRFRYAEDGASGHARRGRCISAARALRSSAEAAGRSLSRIRTPERHGSDQ